MDGARVVLVSSELLRHVPASLLFRVTAIVDH